MMLISMTVIKDMNYIPFTLFKNVSAVCYNLQLDILNS